MSNPVTMALVAKALDAASLRHQAIANNIANANSVGYQSVRVNFEEQLSFARQALSSGGSLSAADVSSVHAFVEAEPAPSSGTPSVMIDMEMVKLAQNTLHYQALIKALGQHASILSTAINEGKR
jgi:flagellar basal-body rod protein FlgB